MSLQRTPDWHLRRSGRANASSYDKVMAGPKYAGWKNYKADLIVERLTGIPIEIPTTREMQWGIDTEPLARLRYTLATGNSVEECGYYEHPTLAAGASPDGLVNTDGLLEIKCPNTATHIATLQSGTVPKKYIWQCNGQLLMTGRQWVDFVSFDPRLPDNAALIIIRVYRDEAAIELLENTLEQFLAEVDADQAFITNYTGVLV